MRRICNDPLADCAVPVADMANARTAQVNGKLTVFFIVCPRFPDMRTLPNRVDGIISHLRACFHIINALRGDTGLSSLRQQDDAACGHHDDGSKVCVSFLAPSSVSPHPFVEQSPQ